MSGQVTSANGCLTGKVQRRRYPLYEDIMGEGAQIAKVEKVAEVEQVLLSRQKKPMPEVWHRIFG